MCWCGEGKADTNAGDTGTGGGPRREWWCGCPGRRGTIGSGGGGFGWGDAHYAGTRGRRRHGDRGWVMNWGLVVVSNGTPDGAPDNCSNDEDGNHEHDNSPFLLTVPRNGVR